VLLSWSSVRAAARTLLQPYSSVITMMHGSLNIKHSRALPTCHLNLSAPAWTVLSWRSGARVCNYGFVNFLVKPDKVMCRLIQLSQAKQEGGRWGLNQLWVSENLTYEKVKLEGRRRLV